MRRASLQARQPSGALHLERFIATPGVNLAVTLRPLAAGEEPVPQAREPIEPNPRGNEVDDPPVGDAPVVQVEDVLQSPVAAAFSERSPRSLKRKKDGISQSEDQRVSDEDCASVFVTSRVALERKDAIARNLRKTRVDVGGETLRLMSGESVDRQLSNMNLILHEGLARAIALQNTWHEQATSAQQHIQEREEMSRLREKVQELTNKLVEEKNRARDYKTAYDKVEKENKELREHKERLTKDFATSKAAAALIRGECEQLKKVFEAVCTAFGLTVTRLRERALSTRVDTVRDFLHSPSCWYMKRKPVMEFADGFNRAVAQIRNHGRCDILLGDNLEENEDPLKPSKAELFADEFWPLVAHPDDDKCETSAQGEARTQNPQGEPPAHVPTHLFMRWPSWMPYVLGGLQPLMGIVADESECPAPIKRVLALVFGLEEPVANPPRVEPVAPASAPVVPAPTNERAEGDGLQKELED